MKITLHIDEKEREFHTTPTARSTRTAYETRTKISAELRARIEEKKQGLYTPEIMDEMTSWVVQAWNNQFTADQYLDGYRGPFTDAVDMMDAQIEMIAEGMVEFPNPKAWETEEQQKSQASSS